MLQSVERRDKHSSALGPPPPARLLKDQVKDGL